MTRATITRAYVDSQDRWNMVLAMRHADEWSATTCDIVIESLENLVATKRELLELWKERRYSILSDGLARELGVPPAVRRPRM